MKYRVIIQPAVDHNIEAVYDYLWTDAPLYAERWLTGIYEAIFSLDQMPRRCTQAADAESWGIEIRQLLYGSHRILFTISGPEVHVLYLQHMRQQRLGKQER